MKLGYDVNGERCDLNKHFRRGRATTGIYWTVSWFYPLVPGKRWNSALKHATSSSKSFPVDAPFSCPVQLNTRRCVNEEQDGTINHEHGGQALLGSCLSCHAERCHVFRTRDLTRNCFASYTPPSLGEYRQAQELCSLWDCLMKNYFTYSK